MIYGYLRVSSDKQDVDSQKQGVVELAKQKKIVINDWIIDDGVSGTKDPNKRNLGGLLHKVQEGDTIICAELSRLGRKLFMVMTILQELMKRKCKLFTVKDRYELGDNIQSAVLAFAFGLSAQIERDMIAMRTKEGLALKRSQGVLLGRGIGVKNSVSRYTEEQKDRIMQLYQDGKSCSAIAKTITKETGRNTARASIAYYLCLWGVYKGIRRGFNLTLLDDTVVFVRANRNKNTEYVGASYCTVQNAFQSGRQMLGVKKIEEVFDDPSTVDSKQFNNRVRIYTPSNNDNIDRETLISLINENKTLPEIYEIMKNDNVSYSDLYDYINKDIELNPLYRTQGMRRVKKVRYIDEKGEYVVCNGKK
jgi:DNA invertase Pin-like site-specific DNA recombinase